MKPDSSGQNKVPVTNFAASRFTALGSPNMFSSLSTGLTVDTTTLAWGNLFFRIYNQYYLIKRTGTTVPVLRLSKNPAYASSIRRVWVM